MNTVMFSDHVQGVSAAAQEAHGSRIGLALNSCMDDKAPRSVFFYFVPLWLSSDKAAAGGVSTCCWTHEEGAEGM